MLASTTSTPSAPPYLLLSSSKATTTSSFPFVQRLAITSFNCAASPSCSIVSRATTRRENRTARHERIRKKVDGTPERPRLCVFRSNKHLYAQVIDDTKMHTLASASTMQKPVSEEFDYSAGPTIEVAKKVGEAITKACLDKGSSRVAFDRGGYPFHCRTEALAVAAREHGLEF